MAAGHGGQILLAESTVVLLSGVDLLDLGSRRLRVMAAGHGGQVLVAESTAGLLSGVDLLDLGPRRLTCRCPSGCFKYEQRDSAQIFRRCGRSIRRREICGLMVLTYELVRTMLRDNRFTMPRGLALAAQGITSGPLWDKAVNNLLSLDGAKHRRLRHLVSKAFTPRASERTRALTTQTISELIDAHTGTGRCDIVTDIARRYPIPIICALLGAPRSDWPLFSAWTDDIFKLFNWNLANDAPDILRA